MIHFQPYSVRILEQHLARAALVGGQVLGDEVLVEQDLRDQAAYRQLFNARELEETLRPWADRTHYTADYSSPETVKWLMERGADIFVVHTPYWVEKKDRELPRKGIVLGGHPGLIPDYRGSHAAFWAVYKRKVEDGGCTVFLIDSGVDTGDIVAQERLPVEKGDSFMTLAWKGMIRIA